MKCGSCNMWKMGIPLGFCTHPDGYYKSTSDRMVFEYVREEECPKLSNALNLLSNIMRYDFTEEIGDLVNHQTILFNKEIISESQVESLVHSGLYEHDSRIIVMTPKQFENVFPKSKQGVK